MSDSQRTPTADALEHLFDTVIGTVTLRVADLSTQRDFYSRAIGLVPDGNGPAGGELADAAGRVVLRLNSSTARGSEPLREPHTGLFHIAFRFPDRASLAVATARTMAASPAFQGAADHGVSEAVYFADPEGNGVELYRDRPFEEWPAAESGRVGMYTRPLDLEALLAEAAEPDRPALLDIGHIHLKTADAGVALGFWRDVVGLDERQRFGAEAVFLADGLYHHHLGANSWHSAGAPAAPVDRPGLEAFHLRLANAASVDATAARLEESGCAVQVEDGNVAFTDPDGNRVRLGSR